jgi:hypothetical protein
MDQQEIELYVDYRRYITVEQVSDLLNSFDQIYDSLFFIETPIDDAPRRPSTKLRVGRANTGNSIIFHLVQGAEQIIRSADPELGGVAGGAAVLALTSRILINNFRRGSLAWYQHRSQELALREQAALVELKEKTSEVITASLSEVTLSGQTVKIDQLAEKIGPQLVLADKVLSQENIARVTIDGETVKDSGQE